MTFRLNSEFEGTQTFCQHVIDEPGIYQPSSEPRSWIDLPFPGLFDSYPKMSSIPYFEIDVTRFNGDPSPILEQCGLDTCVSFGYYI